MSYKFPIADQHPHGWQLPPAGPAQLDADDPAYLRACYAYRRSQRPANCSLSSHGHMILCSCGGCRGFLAGEWREWLERAKR